RVLLLPSLLCPVCALCLRSFLRDPAPTDIYTLSLHDALPISPAPSSSRAPCVLVPCASPVPSSWRATCAWPELSCVWFVSLVSRSEEHTSELQSRENLVCRLLLEKKKEHARQSGRVSERSSAT